MNETTHRLKSAHLGNERTVWIRTPSVEAQFESLVVFLDGEFYRDRVGAVQIIEQLELQSVIAPTLAVFVSYESLDARWIECPCHPPFARFVDEELLPWLDGIHPGATTSPERVLVGLSYTGLAAAFVAMQSPSRFTKVIVQSGSFWWNDCWLGDRYRGLDFRVPAEFYLDVGLAETQENVRHREDVLQVTSQIEGVRGFRDALVEKGHRPQYVEFDGGHDFASWGKTLPGALRWAVPRELTQQPVR